MHAGLGRVGVVHCGIRPFTNHLSSFFNMVVLPTGLLSVWPWEWHMDAANFCLPETQSESQGASLTMRRMRCSPNPHHNGT